MELIKIILWFAIWFVGTLAIVTIMLGINAIIYEILKKINYTLANVILALTTFTSLVIFIELYKKLWL